jgi:hypothetical protein
MTTTVSPPAAAGGSVSEMLNLIKASDTVELKVTVPEVGQRSAIRALGMDPLDAEIRQVFFFDTPDLRLNAAGLVLRARRMQKKGGDSIVKLRPVVPDALSRELRRTDGFGVEVDAMPGGYVCSARLRQMTTADRVADATGGELRLRKLFTKEQRAFLAAHDQEGIGFDDLRVLGPIFVLKLKFSPAGFDRKLVAEAWLFPDSSRILELSTKCMPSEAFQVAAEARAFLEDHGLDLSSEQETKTRHALEVLSAQP